MNGCNKTALRRNVLIVEGVNTANLTTGKRLRAAARYLQAEALRMRTEAEMKQLVAQAAAQQQEVSNEA